MEVSDDLVAWLRAQLDEDERIALDAASTSRSTAKMRGAYSTWVVEGWHGIDPDEPEALISQGTARQPAVLGQFTATPIPRRQAEHIARHDPARVLREVDANRRILDLHRPGYFPDCRGCGDPYPCATAKLLVLPYADAPGYREEWRP